ncbi:hypothetical protein PVAP13_5KG401842 [Panicum virgatum]|uniref:Uncharacterized protein n=1 Tax=Panicum virgatum TaxID=38727 RepID=A0A8T0SQX9_PANVG|nr:hypothetical protein PVAP13_5KG401842 [Panicum virgatum]
MRPAKPMGCRRPPYASAPPSQALQPSSARHRAASVLPWSLAIAVEGPCRWIRPRTAASSLDPASEPPDPVPPPPQIRPVAARLRRGPRSPPPTPQGRRASRRPARRLTGPVAHWPTVPRSPAPPCMPDMAIGSAACVRGSPERRDGDREARVRGRQRRLGPSALLLGRAPTTTTEVCPGPSAREGRGGERGGGGRER